MGNVRLNYEYEDFVEIILNTDYEQRIKFYTVLCELLNKIKEQN
jgi:hypothetical protein